MRGCSACFTASQQASTSPATARARPAMAAPRTSLAMAVTDSKSPGEGGGGGREAGLDEVDPHLLQGAGDLQLLVGAQRNAGRLLAVTEGRIENQYLVLASHLLNLRVVNTIGLAGGPSPDGDRGGPAKVEGQSQRTYACHRSRVRHCRSLRHTDRTPGRDAASFRSGRPKSRRALPPRNSSLASASSSRLPMSCKHCW